MRELYVGTGLQKDSLSATTGSLHFCSAGKQRIHRILLRKASPVRKILNGQRIYGFDELDLAREAVERVALTQAILSIA